MPLSTPVVFPLFGILPTPSGPTCACGKADCSRIGKHPRVAWGEIEWGDAPYSNEEGAGYGLKTGALPRGSGVIVLDTDSREAEVWVITQGASATTYTVRTAKGWHRYYRHPGFHVGNSVGALAKGVDIRGDGGYVVAAGSPHESGATYELVVDAEPAEAPPWLIAWLQARPAPAEVQPHVDDVTDPAELARRKEMYTKYLVSEAPPRGPALRGKGDATLFEVVQRGAYDLALPTSDVLELVREHYDPRCSPMWGDELDERVLHKAHSAKTQSTRPRAEPPPTGRASEVFGGLDMPPVPPGGFKPPAPAPGAKCTWKIRQGGWERRPPPPRFLVEGLLVEGKVSMIFADSGSIKSWTAESIALAVATGTPWLGDAAVDRGGVLYVDFEDAEDEFNRRIYLLNGGRPADDLHYVYQPEHANQPNFWLQLAMAVRERGIKLVIVDTLAGASPNEDENATQAARALQDAGRFTTEENVTMTFLHHANRNGDIRGTSAFKANVDSLFSLETIEEDEDKGIHRAKLVNTKSGHRKVKPVCLELTDAGLTRFVEEPKPVDADGKPKKRTHQELEAEIYLLLETQGPIGAIETIRSIVNAGAGPTQAALSELTAQGRIFKGDGGYQPDDEAKRVARLLAAVDARPNWSRAKLLPRAFVTGEFFDRAVADRLIVPRASGKVDLGYLKGETTIDLTEDLPTPLDESKGGGVGSKV